MVSKYLVAVVAYAAALTACGDGSQTARTSAISSSGPTSSAVPFDEARAIAKDAYV